MKLSLWTRIRRFDPPSRSPTEFESCHVLREILDFATGVLDLHPIVKARCDLGTLLTFTDKWDCRQLFNSILQYVPRMFVTDDKTVFLRAFVLEAKWGAPCICINAMHHELAMSCWDPTDTAVMNYGASTQFALLDPRSMPAWVIHEMPPFYLWALGRSIGSSVYDVGVPRLQNEFKALLENWWPKQT